jgi:hypothetical protein
MEVSLHSLQAGIVPRCNALVVMEQGIARILENRCIGAHFIARGVGVLQCNEFIAYAVGDPHHVLIHF